MIGVWHSRGIGRFLLGVMMGGSFACLLLILLCAPGVGLLPTLSSPTVVWDWKSPRHVAGAEMS